MVSKLVTAAIQDRLFYAWCEQMDLPAPDAEYVFDKLNDRKWRFDYAWPEQKVALEVEGGIYIQGRHSRGWTMEKDMEKYNEAAAQGWRLLRTTPRNLMKETTFDWLRRTLEA